MVKLFKAFAGSGVPPEIAGGAVSWEEATALAAAAPQVRTDLPVLSGSLLLYICGRFEYFVRELVVALADDLAANAAKYEDLPERLRKELQTRTLDIAQNPRRFGYSEAEAIALLLAHAANLGPNANVGAVTISSRVVTVTESNMNQQTTVEIFKRVSIPDLWVEIGKQASLRIHLEEASDRVCSAAAAARLDELMKERNSVAHPTGTVTFPDPEKVLESVAFLKVLSQVIVDVALLPRPVVGAAIP